MNEATFYKKDTGKFMFLMTGGDQEAFDLNVSESVGYILGSHDKDLAYADKGQAKDRPVFSPAKDKESILADGSDVLTISSLPKGTTYFELIGPVMDAWTETRLKTDLTINVPGHYRLKITQWPYQDQMVTFNAS